MTRTNDEPEPPQESGRDLHESSCARGKPSDPPPRAARLGAASGVEGPGRAQRQRREHDRPLYDAHRKEQPLKKLFVLRNPVNCPLPICA